jgi:hypothetical protein
VYRQKLFGENSAREFDIANRLCQIALPFLFAVAAGSDVDVSAILTVIIVLSVTIALTNEGRNEFENYMVRIKSIP